MLINCVTACDSRLNEFESQKSKNNQYILKLVVCMCMCALAYFICFWCQKMIGKGHNINMAY